jgi:hypothetical protein
MRHEKTSLAIDLSDAMLEAVFSATYSIVRQILGVGMR